MADALIAYWLPESRVRIVGRTEYVWPIDWERQRIESVPVSAVELSFYASADTSSGRGRAAVRLVGGRTADRDFVVTLHPDGRVASFSSKQVEQLDAILGNAAKLAGAAAVIGLAFVNPGAAVLAAGAAGRAAAGSGTTEARSVAPDEASGGDQKPRAKARHIERDPAERFTEWATLHPSSAARGRRLHADLVTIDTSLSASLIDLVAGLATRAEPLAEVKVGTPARPPHSPTETSEAVKAWTELRTARDTLAEDLEAIEASIRAWADRSRRASAERDYSCAVIDLPSVDALMGELDPATGADQPWSEELRVRLVRLDPDLKDAGKEDDPDILQTNDIRLRLPRPVTLGLYVCAEETDEWRLDQSFDVAVVDENSRVTAIPLDIGEKADRTVTVSVGADGIPVQIGVMQGSGLNEMFSALGQLPAGLAAGATSAKDIVASTSAAQVSAGSITNAALTRRISELEMDKQLIDAELAYAAAASTRALNERKARLEARVEVAKQLKALAEQNGAAVDAAALLANGAG